jgi:redox-sensing transcriptional repressor
VPRKNNPRHASDQVSELTAGRLSLYLRSLNVLDAAGVKTVSSRALAEQFHLNAAQIRKDLAYFGEFGIRGVGYYVKELKRQLRVILGLDRTVRVAVLGAGNLGMALADYPGFRQEGFEIIAMFDADRGKVGMRSRGGVPIFDIAQFQAMVEADQIHIAVIAVPADAAQQVVDTAVGAGIRAILNFSPGTIQVAPSVKLKNVDLTVSIESLSFFLARGEADDTNV